MYHNFQNTFGTIYLLTLSFLCLCFLCIVICMHSFHSAHIFIVCISVICTNNSIFELYNGHIVLNYTAHFVYSPLNSYVYIHWILDFKIYIIINHYILFSSFLYLSIFLPLLLSQCISYNMFFSSSLKKYICVYIVFFVDLLLIL